MIALNAILPAGIHENGSSHDVSLQENIRIFNRPVHMAIRREVHYDVRVLLLKESIQPPVSDIHLDKAEIRRIHHRP